MSGGVYNQYTGRHHRRSIRLRGYDYSQPGVYFVTICINDRKQNFFGDIISGKMDENAIACIVRKWWDNFPVHFPNIKLDEFVIMPNHIHGIIIIRDFPLVGAGSSRPMNSGSSRPMDHISLNDDYEHNDMGRDDRAPTLGNMVAYFKYQTTKQINAYRNSEIQKIWQRNYYDHIIRDETSLYFIRQYIRMNPVTWNNDFENHLFEEIKKFHLKLPGIDLKGIS